MKNPFFKRKKEREELNLRYAMLEQEKSELLKSLASVRLSKDKKIDELAEELSSLRKSNEKEIKHYQEMLRHYSEMLDTSRNETTIQSDKLKKLQEKNDELRLLIPTEFPISEIMSSCANKAWNGMKSTRTFVSLDGKVKLFFDGTVYEPCYEDFTAGCCVYYLEEGMEKRKPLYTIDSRNVAAYKNEEIEFGSVDNIREYLITKNLGFKEI